jgi:hypothetical protein
VLSSVNRAIRLDALRSSGIRTTKEETAWR